MMTMNKVRYSVMNHSLDEIKEDILSTPDDNEFGYFIECD